MLTDNGLSLIKYFEGCKFNAYLDTAGIPTIGYGHTKDVVIPSTCTQTEATLWLLEDLDEAEVRVDTLISVQLLQCELDSLVSCAFNLRSFPKLAGYVNQDKKLFCEKLVLYCHDVQGHELLGLKKRRWAERWLFEGMTWTDIQPRMKDIV